MAWVAYAARTPMGLKDPWFYSRFAEFIAEGEGYRQAFVDTPTAYYPVGYPAVLGALWWVVTHTPIPDDLTNVAAGANLVLGLVSVVLAAQLARQLFRDNCAGLVAGALMALWPNLIFHTAAVLTETLFNTLVLAAVLVLVGARWTGGHLSTRRLVVFGVVLALASLVRPISILVVPALAVVLLLSGRGWRPALGQVGVVAVATAAVMAPWAIRNSVVLDAPVLLSTNLGDNLCIGHNPRASGAFGLPPYCFAGYDDVFVEDYEVRRNRYTTDQALDWALGHPLEEAELLFWRSFHTLAHDHDAIGAVESYGENVFISDRWRSVFEWVADMWFFAALGLTALSIVVLRREQFRPEIRLLVALMVAIAAPVLVFFGDPRFHVPLIPFMAVILGAGLLRLNTAVSESLSLLDGERDQDGDGDGGSAVPGGALSSAP